ncbi:MAG TPA: hypothetical protein PLW35_05910 [Verrucomicrobiota bacterium]|nr:hypothetical protein [Verrucomicrobiota bacterium]
MFDRPRGLIAIMIAAASMLAGFDLLEQCARSDSANESAPAQQSTRSTPPPLQVEEDTPLLLDSHPPDEPPGGVSAATSVPHINSACYVCHANYKNEELAHTHAKTNVGCVNCHGPSRAHALDEANLTPPDIMYWPSRIATSCYLCHTNHNAPAKTVIMRWQQRCVDKDPKYLVCTDCHGDHRLRVRTTIWNKRTGEVVSKSRPRVIAAQPGAQGAQAGPAPESNQVQSNK